jgi:hypothetical protein
MSTYCREVSPAKMFDGSDVSLFPSRSSVLCGQEGRQSQAYTGRHRSAFACASVLRTDNAFANILKHTPQYGCNHKSNTHYVNMT